MQIKKSEIYFGSSENLFIFTVLKQQRVADEVREYTPPYKNVSYVGYKKNPVGFNHKIFRYVLQGR